MTNADRCGKEIAQMVRAFDLEKVDRASVKRLAFNVARLVAGTPRQGELRTEWDADLTQAELEMGL